MDIERKSVDAAVTPVEDSKSKHGEFDVILSTSSLDRDGDELYADEWKQPLPDKITFDSDHGMSVATCVGSGRPFINDQGQLQVRGTFASTPHGQAVRTLVNEGHIDRVSVAFRNLPKTSKDAKPQRELLNGAFVAVPANDEARVLSSKAAKKDADDKKPYGDVEYADPKNGKYPIDTAEHVRAAWSYINQQRDSDKYSAEELARIKDKIKRAAEKFGIDISEKQLKDAANWRDDTMAAISAMFDNDPLDGGDQSHKTAYFQGIHDLAVKLGAGCPYSDPQATPGVLNGPGNRSVHDVETKSSTEPAAPTDAPDDAVVAETIKDDVARAKALMFALDD